jgi:hypothetical protein
MTVKRCEILEITRVDEGGTYRIGSGDVFTGTTVMYAAVGDDSFGMQCDYTLNTLEETHVDEVRAFRRSLRLEKKRVRPLAKDRVKDELVVIFGPEMTARSAVETLTALAKKIEREGLLIGRDQAYDYITETADRVPTKRDEITSDDNWRETAVAADSVGKSKVELRAQRADTFAELVTALAVDVAKELTVLSAMDIETIDPARHVETMTTLLEADELVTHLLLAIDEIKRQVAKPQ